MEILITLFSDEATIATKFRSILKYKLPQSMTVKTRSFDEYPQNPDASDLKKRQNSQRFEVFLITRRQFPPPKPHHVSHDQPFCEMRMAEKNVFSLCLEEAK